MHSFFGLYVELLRVLFASYDLGSMSETCERNRQRRRRKKRREGRKEGME